MSRFLLSFVLLPTIAAVAQQPTQLFSLEGGREDVQASVESSSAQVPDARTSTAETSTSAASGNEQQTKRILDILPNFRAVDANTTLPPQTAREKFITASQDSFDYSAIWLPIALAGYSQVTAATPEFQTGMPAYLRYLWHSYADQADENYFVEFIVPTLTHEDNRYYTLGRGGGSGLKRVGYALSRTVVTRNDAGKETFNISEVVGAGASAGLSDLYYPSRERTFGSTADKWGIDVGVDAIAFVVKEFWPDISHSLQHKKKSQMVASSQ
jgi:hypothetical protein